MKNTTSFILFLLSLITGIISYPLALRSEDRLSTENNSIPFIYIIKAEGDSCPDGQKMSHYEDDVSPSIKESGCKPIASDAGKICTQKSDCENNCIFAIKDLENLGCESYSCRHTGASCPVTVDCKGLLGRCEATEGESSNVITQAEQAECLCSGV
jgi:hypothetical protein